MGFLPWEIWVAFPRESQLRQNRATQPTVHAGCFSVSIIHQTLTWTTGSLTCAQMLMHVIAYGVVWTHLRQPSLKDDSWRKILWHTRELNLRQQSDGPILQPTELHPHPKLIILQYFIYIHILLLSAPLVIFRGIFYFDCMISI